MFQTPQPGIRMTARKRKEAQHELLLDALTDSWPDHHRFPHNFRGDQVRDVVWQDLLSSRDSLLVTGYTSLEWVVDLLADLHERGANGVGELRRIRILIGFEPRVGGAIQGQHSPQSFTTQIGDYWLSRGISLHRSAKVIAALEQLKSRRVEVRKSGQRRIHAKLYLGDSAVTVGSSNFSRSGMMQQTEGNVRFERSESPRFEETAALGEAIWTTGDPFKKELRELLIELLSVVTWEEALARAVAEILEGRWSRPFVEPSQLSEGPELWPAQRQGVGQAMWVLENSGSVLVADATGSGKTKMGAHLIRALENRNWGTGRARRERPVMVCPPAVESVWEDEADSCGQSLQVYSHGLLSKSKRLTQVRKAVSKAQILAIDEAHNFLNLSSQRTRAVVGNLADNVVLFTATPINRGPTDLLSVMDLLGADNFDDEVLDTVTAISKRARRSSQGMSEGETRLIRAALSEFVIRRTKTEFNRLIDLEPHLYKNKLGKPCRYPEHDAHLYETGETSNDRRIAGKIRDLSQSLQGLINLRSPIQLPEYMKWEGLTEEAYVKGRLSGARAIVAWRVNASLRSSRAALWEHVYGTESATDHFGLQERFKPASTGDVISTLKAIRKAPPEILVASTVPDWLTDSDAHAEACDHESEVYHQIGRLCHELSESRTLHRARVLLDMAQEKRLVLGFDRSLISLFLIKRALIDLGWSEDDLIVATSDPQSRQRLSDVFELTATEETAIGLCSDAMSEAVNLQRAAAVVHLDLPTVIRTLEQRVGRIDRMDSPHDAIDVHWPDNSPEFSLRTDERLVARHQVVEDLLGSNVPIPEDFLLDQTARGGPTLDTSTLIETLKEEQESGVPWDELRDAFFPVRQLIGGGESVLSEAIYDKIRVSKARVVSAVSVVTAEEEWAFLAIKGVEGGAPRWILFREEAAPPSTNLEEVCLGLRELLTPTTEDRAFDNTAGLVLDKALDRLRSTEQQLLPRKKGRALDEMSVVLNRYRKDARKTHDQPRIRLIERLLSLLDTQRHDEAVDLGRVADWWLDVIRPTWYAHLTSRRRKGVARLKAIRRQLYSSPFTDEQLRSAFDHVRAVPSLDRRVVAAIIGVPG